MRGAEHDAAARLLDFGAEIKRRFANPIPSVLKETGNGIAIEFDGDQFVNTVVLSEDVAEGDGVTAFDVLVRSRLIYRPACVYTGTAIGHKRIISFPYIRAKEIIVRVNGSNDSYKLGKPEAYLV